jgi:hypothetical protein
LKYPRTSVYTYSFIIDIPAANMSQITEVRGCMCVL